VWSLSTDRLRSVTAIAVAPGCETNVVRKSLELLVVVKGYVRGEPPSPWLADGGVGPRSGNWCWTVSTSLAGGVTKAAPPTLPFGAERNTTGYSSAMASVVAADVAALVRGRICG